jgi:hypothetical protein
MSQFISGIFGGTPNVNSSSTTGSTTNGQTSSSGASNTSANSSNVNTSTPNLPGWYSSFLQGIPGQIGQAQYQASQPLLGPAQASQFQQGVNRQAGASINNLTQQLAKNGSLNSGALASGISGIQQGANQQIGAYNAQAPVTNQQNTNSLMSNLLGQSMNFKIPYGQTSTGQNYSNTFGNTFNQGYNSSSTNGQSYGVNSQGLGGVLGNSFGDMLPGILSQLGV